jgi:predicted metal-dependent hydrolase
MMYAAIQEDLAKAVKLFNRWQFEEAHDAFNKLAKEIEGRERSFLEGIAKLASGFHRIWNKGGEPNTMVEYLEEGWKMIQQFDNGMFGLDLAEFDQGIPACMEEAARWRRGDVEIFNRDYIPRIEYIDEKPEFA